MQESVRLRRALRGLGVPIDVLVVAQREADRRSVVRGTVVERALREGGRSLTPEEAEEARRLMTAARSDLRAARLLPADTQQSARRHWFSRTAGGREGDQGCARGFGSTDPLHARSRVSSRHPRPHAIAAPDSVADADWLTPWAVAARHGASDAALDRETAVLVADKAAAWAGATIDIGA